MKAKGFSFKVFTALYSMLLALTTLTVGAQALTPTTGISADYKTGRFYSNLISLKLTSDQPTDVIMVAMSQLGYHEGNSQSDFDGLNTSGSGNYVEYNYGCNANASKDYCDRAILKFFICKEIKTLILLNFLWNFRKQFRINIFINHINK